MEYKNLNLSHLDLSAPSERKIAAKEIVKFTEYYLAGLTNPEFTSDFYLMENRHTGKFSLAHSGRCVWEIEFKPF